MEEEWTCGKGLEHHSAIPSKIAEYAAALADVLQTHLKALDPKDEQAIPELEAYSSLARDFGAIAKDLEATATRMAGYLDLPMAPHDEAVLRDPRWMEPFRTFVKREQELLAALQTHVARDTEMVESMG